MWLSITLKPKSCLATKLRPYFADRINHCRDSLKKGCQKRKRNVFLKPCLKLLPVFKGERKTLIKPPFFGWFWIMDKELSNRKVMHSSQGAIKHLESMSLVPGLTERWRVMNLTFVRDLLLSSAAYKLSLGVSSLQPCNCYWALSPLGSEIIESICMQSAFKHQVKWKKIRIASLWRSFQLFQFTSASRSGRHYSGSQTQCSGHCICSWLYLSKEREER